jgi:hypothetical protein
MPLKCFYPQKQPDGYWLISCPKQTYCSQNCGYDKSKKVVIIVVIHYWKNVDLGICVFPPGAAAASRLYVEAINKLAKQAQQGTWGGSSDIGKYNATLSCMRSLLAGVRRNRYKSPFHILCRALQRRRSQKLKGYMLKYMKFEDWNGTEYF